METHLRSKVTKLITKVKAKILKLNKLLKEEKIKELAKSGQGADDYGDNMINEITFAQFTDGIFPWESAAEGIHFNT